MNTNSIAAWDAAAASDVRLMQGLAVGLHARRDAKSAQQRRDGVVDSWKRSVIHWQQNDAIDAADRDATRELAGDYLDELRRLAKRLGKSTQKETESYIESVLNKRDALYLKQLNHYVTSYTVNGRPVIEYTRPDTWTAMQGWIVNNRRLVGGKLHNHK